MAYIHTKKVGGKTYYTLRISVRDDGRVITKDLVNLGDDIAKINFEDLEKKYGSEIRNSYRTIKRFLDKNHYLIKAQELKLKKTLYFSKEELEEIESLKLHYSQFLKLHKKTQEAFFEGFILQFSVNSTSIEGNTITLAEAKKLFNENTLPKDRDLREVYDLTNTKKVLLKLRESKEELSLKLIIQVHDELLENIDDRKGLRNHDIHIFKQPFKPSPVRYVKQDLELLLKWYKEQENKLHHFELAILFHHKFESIHPFSDGNGRTGRVIMNHILHLKNYPPTVISRRNRKEYLDVMNAADKAIKKSLTETNNENYNKLIKFTKKEYETSYWDNFLF